MLIYDVAEHIAGALRPDDGSRVPAALPDHLERWLEVREAVPWREASGSGEDGPVTPASDGAADSVRTFDCVLDPARGAGPLAALERAGAGAGRRGTRRRARLRAAARLAAARSGHP
ncbi:hypothetical protein U5640_38310 [Streptomyces sp. SS7]|uniref:hypothetical protein n=1 Tax=Streptomyces sp. SS7 TaxID=3108485 RepID=UPI0030EB64CB